MSKFNSERYKYATTPDGKVIAISSFAGKVVKGVAKCDPNDEFNLESGKKLAAARCNEKVCRRRARWHVAIWEQMEELARYWRARADEAAIRRDQSLQEHFDAIDELEAIKKEM